MNACRSWASGVLLDYSFELHAAYIYVLRNYARELRITIFFLNLSTTARRTQPSISRHRVVLEKKKSENDIKCSL